MAKLRAGCDYRSRVLEEVTRRVGCSSTAARTPGAAWPRSVTLLRHDRSVRWPEVTRRALADQVRPGCPCSPAVPPTGTSSTGVAVHRVGTLHPGLARVLREFSGVDGSAVLDWLTTPSAAFDGMCATELLVLGGDPERVVTAAADDASRWAA